MSWALPKETLSTPPLYARLWTGEGEEVSLLAERDVTPEIDLSRDWTCEVRAPGGKRGRGRLKARDGGPSAETYKEILSFLKETDPLRLWFAPVLAADISPGARELILDTWSLDGRPAGRAVIAFKVPERQPRWLDPGISPGNAYFLGTSGRGVPVFSIMRHGDRLLVDSVIADGVLSTATSVFSWPGYHTVYWNFLRLGWLDAASEAAKRLLLAVRCDQDRAENLLAAAHAVIRFAEFRNAMPELNAWLQDAPQSLDVGIMRWVLDFESARRDASVERILEITRRLEGEKPVFGETFRLFYERFHSAIALAERRGIDAARLESSAKRVDRLAESAYWGAEHLTFRGRSPADPDPEAVLGNSAAQKKTSPRSRAKPSRYTSGM